MPDSSLHPEQIGRYRIHRVLGAGANGCVYAAEPPDGGALLALKVLRGDSREFAADLKREFRLVSDLTHRNLVLLHELDTDGDQVFFTMDLIDGQPLFDWLDEAGTEERGARIRSALWQLADGIAALHRHNLLHRDIKPSNVLVDGDGRVVLLDFGLVRAIGQESSNQDNFYISGTPAYLSPEVLMGATPSPAADGYALGVLLHQALTGRFPPRSHSYGSPEPPSALSQVETDSEELMRICRALLAPLPSNRWSMQQVLQALQPSSTPPRRLVDVVLERDDELAALRSAAEATRAQQTSRVVHVVGASGMGKSALLRAFARRERKHSWVLEGRAYERDRVPYKALDGAIDQLATAIEALSETHREALRPPQLSVLTTIFPELQRAFRRVRQGTSASDPVRGDAHADPVGQRRLAVRALRTLLTSIAARFGLVICLDDLQWGDLDAARLLTDVLAEGTVPGLLLVLSYRAEQDDSPFLQTFRAFEASAQLPSQALAVRPLSPHGAEQLATLVTGDSTAVQALVAEADGCPFLLEMLLSTPSATPNNFEHALTLRMQQLSEPAKHMLQALCLAGRPMTRTHVPFAPKDATAARAAWASLISARMLRSEGLEAAHRVEPYHDRIRVEVVRGLDTKARYGMHHALGDAFASTDDVEGAALHYAAAGDVERAAPFALRAAERAQAALAFDRAAQYYAVVLQGMAQDAPERDDITRRMGRALAAAGHAAEAAPHLLSCARRAEGLEALQLQREAMEQYLVAGRVDEGEQVMDELLQALGVWRPSSARVTVAAMYSLVAALVLRGPKMRGARSLPALERLRLETFASIGRGYAAYDATLGTWLYLRALNRALDHGDRAIAADGIAYAASLLGFTGTSYGRKLAMRWLEQAERLAEESLDPRLRATCLLSRGIIECCAGEWPRCVQTFDEVGELVRTHAPHAHWEDSTARSTALMALMQAGRFNELQQRARGLVHEARERDNLALGVEAGLYLALPHLMLDDARAALQHIDQVIAQWTVRGYHFQHLIALRLRCYTWLYEGRPERALAALHRELPQAERANLTSMQIVGIELHDLLGRAALGSAARTVGPERTRLLREAREQASRLDRYGLPHAGALALKLRGGLALLEGQPKEAARHYGDASVRLRQRGMELEALCTLIAQDDAAGEHESNASRLALLSRHHVRNPRALACMILGMPLASATEAATHGPR